MIVFFHLLSDFSGSPKVLKTVIEGLLLRNYEIHLYTSKKGILNEFDNTEKFKKYTYRYIFYDSKIITFFSYLLIQMYLFFRSFKYLFEKKCVFYINTLLPVGPALAGAIMKKKIIYHYHENADIKGYHYIVLSKIMQRIATQIICVSNDQAEKLGNKNKVIVIPNSTSVEFYDYFNTDKIKKLVEPKTVLMLSSLKKYKGIIEFTKLANKMQHYDFMLVINDNKNNIQKFFDRYVITASNNLTVFSQTNNVIQFYEKASLLLNLTDPNEFIETFGLTAIEAMTAGLPVIVPELGGIAELVEDGENGFKTNVHNLEKIMIQIDYILSSRNIYERFSKTSKKISQGYSYQSMIDKIEGVIKFNLI